MAVVKRRPNTASVGRAEASIAAAHFFDSPGTRSRIILVIAGPACSVRWRRLSTHWLTSGSCTPLSISSARWSARARRPSWYWSQPEVSAETLYSETYQQGWGWG